MAKQKKYEKKTTISVVGKLELIDNNEYVIMVEDKDDVVEYDLKDILKEIEGSIVSISSEIL